MRHNKYRFSPWDSSNIPMNTRLYMEQLCDNYSGLEITLKGEEINSTSYKLLFENFVGYRNFNEGDRVKFIHEHPEIAINQSLFWAKGDRTSLMSWIVDQATGILSEEGLIHFLIASPEDVIDIICYDFPIVKTIAV